MHPAAKLIQEKVVDATTPLSGLTYADQVAKKQREAKTVALQLQSEVLAANTEAKPWIEMQVCLVFDNS